VNGKWTPVEGLAPAKANYCPPSLEDDGQRLWVTSDKNEVCAALDPCLHNVIPAGTIFAEAPDKTHAWCQRAAELGYKKKVGDVEPFEKLNRQEKVSAVSKRFNISRVVIMSATNESLEEVWKKEDLKLLKGSDGKDLISGGKPQEQQEDNKGGFKNGLADTLAEAVKDKVFDEKRVYTIANEVVTKRTPAIVESTLVKVDAKLTAFETRLEQKFTKDVVVVLPETKETKDMGKQHTVFPEVLKLVSLRLNVWMAGPAGAGKSYLAAEIARALDRPFFRISCGPQTAASQIFGHTTAHGGYAQGIAYQALTNEKGAILLFDEFDRLNPAVGVMVNGLLDGGAVTFPNGETLKQTDKTTYLVAANTFGKPTADFGTALRQDTATMSRFVKVFVPVDEQLEKAVFGDGEWVKFVQKVRGVVKRLGVTSLVVTPRASEYGVRMLASGMSRKTVEEMLLWNGTPDEDVKKIKANLLV